MKEPLWIRVDRAMPSLRTPIFLLALILGGCARMVPSTDLPLSKLSFQISVLARSGSEAEVLVSIRPGRLMTFSTQRVELTGGDRLIAEVDGKSYELKGAVLPNAGPGYRVEIPITAPKAAVRVVLVRPGRPVVPIATERDGRSVECIQGADC